MVYLGRSLISTFLVVGTLTTCKTTKSLWKSGTKKDALVNVAALRLPAMISHDIRKISTTKKISVSVPSATLISSSTFSSRFERFMIQSTFTDNNSHDLIVDEYHDVVLFGIGDLRVDDHGGLIHAVQLQQQISDTSNNKNIHCCFLCTDSVLSNVCGIVSHTVDTVNCIVSALCELDIALQNIGLHPVHCIMTTTDDVTGNELDILNYIQDHIIAHSSSTQKLRCTKVRIHACDLGPIDNEMKYGAYGQLQSQQRHGNDNSSSTFLYEMIPWKSLLRTEPWEQVQGMNYNRFPRLYPCYQSQYCTSADVVVQPQSINTVYTTTCIGNNRKIVTETNDSIPSSEKILGRLVHLWPSDDAMNDSTNTGLYGSHYGGIASNNTVGCISILQHLRTYCNTCNEDDTTFRQYIEKQYDDYLSLIPQRNKRSLEHAAMKWQLDGGDGNWLDGELMNRLLLIPLYLGTISPRRIWHTAGRPRQSYVQTTLWNPPPLRTLVEGREWHTLLAARNYYESQHQPQMTPSTPVTTQYKYWRYHGLLCRYALTDFGPRADISAQKEGILLVHGFGASGSQWNKAMSALSNTGTALHQGLAPDLIGFGQSEKPSISYTSYMWDSQIMDFVKDIAIPRHQWRAFITGGNSIGGYTSMSFAACDAAIDKEVTSSGSSGTRMCRGLVLMNSAGPLKTKNEVELVMQAEGGNAVKSISIAVATASLNLPPCKPPPRPVARLFGNVLLSYLRPNIQSICRNLYPTNPAAVDDILVNDIERDSLDPGAINVMMAGAKLPPPRTSNELLGAQFGGALLNCNGILESQFNGPVLIAQGVLDPLNDSTDRMNRFHSLREGIDVVPIQAGHCPHDELPTEIAQSIANWWSMRGPVNAKGTV